MILKLHPQVGRQGAPATEIVVAGDTVTVDGVSYDLSAVPEGGRATPKGEHPFVGSIGRAGGELSVELTVTLPPNADPVQPVGPAHWTVTVPSGSVSIPAALRGDA
jgi:hypothetical protein